jgi:hypothetical protein
VHTRKHSNNFEREMLQKIFGPVNIDNIWRIQNNMEIDKLIEGADIVRFIKAQRIKWLGSYIKNGPSKTKTVMARGCHGRLKKAENKKLEGNS